MENSFFQSVVENSFMHLGIVKKYFKLLKPNLKLLSAEWVPVKVWSIYQSISKYFQRTPLYALKPNFKMLSGEWALSKCGGKMLEPLTEKSFFCLKKSTKRIQLLVLVLLLNGTLVKINTDQYCSSFSSVLPGLEILQLGGNQ